jgi:hypothetical protein
MDQPHDTFAAFLAVAGALHDAGFDDLDGGDPIRWITEGRFQA